MRTLIIDKWLRVVGAVAGIRKEHRLMLVLMVLWSLVSRFFSSPEFSTGINESLPIMILISLITFLILLYLCWWLLDRFWKRAGLPGIEVLVSGFKEMKVWEQLGFYWLSFALLLLTGLGCLAVVL